MEGAGPARGEGAKRLSTSMLRRVSAHVAPSRVLGLGVLLLILLFALLFILLDAVVLRVGCSRPTGVGCRPSVGEEGLLEVIVCRVIINATQSRLNV